MNAIRAQGACMVISQRRHRIDRHPFDSRSRHLIAIFFCEATGQTDHLQP
ncbi:hypothetical protein [Komagataeibacter kakiaceti]|nr:hypothetical protein [Komagataeibacter kakiaceti]